MMLTGTVLVRAICCVSVVAAVASSGTFVAIAAGPQTAPDVPADGSADWVWVKMEEPKGLPLLGNESAAVFDTAIQRMILFGGHLGNGGPQRFYTWLYDPAANQWHDAKPANRPPGACCVREGIYDPANRRTYYLGGHSFNHGWQWRSQHVRGGGWPWAYDSQANIWTCMKPLVGRAKPWTGAACDSEHQVVVTYGGEGFYETTVWVYDGYCNTWTALKRSGEGPAYGGHTPAMAFDVEHKVTLMFGAGYGKDSRDELWAYDLVGNSWRLLNAANSPKRKGMPLLIYDSINRMPVLFAAEDNVPLKAFAYDWVANAWKELAVKGNPPPSHALLVGSYDPIGHQTILGKGLVYGSSTTMRRPDATYILRHPRLKPRPDALVAPADVTVVTRQTEAELIFQAVPAASSYAIYRGTGPVPWQVKFHRLAETKEPKWLDSGLARGEAYHYFVRAVDGKGVEGAGSVKVRAQPRVPATPVVSVLNSNEVEVAWSKNAEPDVAGYNVYRVKGGELTRLTESPVAQTNLTDKLAVLGGGDVSIRYLVRAVNRLGVESGPSPWATTVPAEPTGVRAREEDGKAVVSWLPSPQKSLKGYNIYRADSGSGDARTIARKIAGPIAETRFIDESKTDRKTCKYYVVPVDALDQEGYSSAGAWFNE